jgi:hypothetical protein
MAVRAFFLFLHLLLHYFPGVLFIHQAVAGIDVSFVILQRLLEVAAGYMPLFNILIARLYQLIIKF